MYTYLIFNIFDFKKSTKKKALGKDLKILFQYLYMPLSTIYKSFCHELATCVVNKNMGKYEIVYEIARKSAPSCFSKKNKEKYESDILRIVQQQIRSDKN